MLKPGRDLLRLFLAGLKIRPQDWINHEDAMPEMRE